MLNRATSQLPFPTSALVLWGTLESDVSSFAMTKPQMLLCVKLISVEAEFRGGPCLQCPVHLSHWKDPSHLLDRRPQWM